MKYKLINKNSCSKNGVLREGESCRFNDNCIYPNCCEEHLCDKVTIDGFDYYVSGEYKDGDYVILPLGDTLMRCINGTTFIEGTQKVIATNNPNIDIPKIVSSASLGLMCANNSLLLSSHKFDHLSVFYGFEKGYNKSQETHPFSEDDMIEFLNWIGKDGYPCIDKNKKGFWVLDPRDPKDYTPKELIELWKEKKLKIVYYE